MTGKDYRRLVASLLKVNELTEYEQGMADYYHSVGIPASICVLQIHSNQIEQRHDIGGKA